MKEMSFVHKIRKKTQKHNNRYSTTEYYYVLRCVFFIENRLKICVVNTEDIRSLMFAYWLCLKTVLFSEIMPCE